MNYRSCALIISLSLVLCGTAYTARKDKKDTAEKEDPQKTSDSAQKPQSVKDLHALVEDLSNQVNTLSSQYTELDNSYQALSSSVDVNSLVTQIQEIKDEQQSILTELETLIENQSTYVAAKSTTSVEEEVARLKQDQEDILALLVSLKDSQDELTEEFAHMRTSMAQSTTATNAAPVSTTSTKNMSDNTAESAAGGIKQEGSGLVPSEVTLEESAGQQYIKLKLVEDGQEIELYLDPTYVDMDLDLTNMQKAGQKNTFEPKTTQPDPHNIDNVITYLTGALQQQPTAPATSQPSYTYNYTAPQAVEQPKQRPRSSVSSTQAEDPRALDELYKAQKLFYAKKYNAALNAAQRSLTRQETALGYALEGSIYFTMGDTTLAIDSWERALVLDPEMTEVRRALFKYKR